MHVVIAGGSGFVGQALQNHLLSQGMKVTVLTRSPSPLAERNERWREVKWLTTECQPEAELGQVDAVINLAGESLNGLRWTKRKKRNIVESRLATTKEIIRIISKLEEMPKVFINASAVGYYGMSDTESFSEETISTADDFLATVVQTWEEEALQAASLGVRTVLARFGVVLGQGGALPLMVLPYKFGIGGTIGSGRQWQSWVHIADAVGLIHYAIVHDAINGPLNITAPYPEQMVDFGKTIGRILKRPHWLPVPSLAMKLALGEMSSMLLSGQHVLPAKAQTYGYPFHYPDLEGALQDILKTR